MNAKHKYIIIEGAIGPMHNAGGKAPADIVEFLSGNGYEPVSIDYINKPRSVRRFLIPWYVLKLARTVKAGSTLVFQHPYDTYHDALRIINRLCFKFIRSRDVKKVAIVHDIMALRYEGKDIAEEIACLNGYDCVIAHSERMKKFLVQAGYRGEVRVLGLFDYKVSRPNSLERRNGRVICYAGNLEKAEFLIHADDICSKNGIALKLYGSEAPLSLARMYNGRFDSCDLSHIEGNWGLVWDGKSAESCEGEFGKYLAYNSPHKASMYVCAGLPLIVPRNSAVAVPVLEQGLGITVDSLYELGEAINDISDSEYRQMAENVAKAAERLMNGRNLLEVLELRGEK